MSDDNFRSFYAEVEAKLEVLDKESRELSYLESNAREIKSKVESIKIIF